MTKVIVLDSAPLGLLFQKPGYQAADECREWLKRHLSAGAQIVVPEIVNYELRREPLRMGRIAAVDALAQFNRAIPGRFMPTTTRAMDRAAELWAQARQQGKPTAAAHALDIDVILCAQVLTEGMNHGDAVVATTNVAHLSRFVPAELWRNV